MKVDSIASRFDKRNIAKDALHVFYECGKVPDEILTDDDHNAAMRNMKPMTYRTNELMNLVKNWMKSNNVDCMCTPSQVEWQCMHLEHKNAVDGMMSNDGNNIVIGAKKIFFNVNFNSETFQVYEKSVDSA